MPQELNIFVKIVNVKTFLRDVAKKKTGKCGNFEKTGGGLPESHFHVFTVFNMGDLPKINGKIGKKFPNRGEGSPTWEKFPHFPVFFFWQRP